MTLNTQYVTTYIVLIIKGVKKMSETRDILEGIYNGEIPVRRRNPQTGATEDVYFYYDDDREELREVKPAKKDTTTRAYREHLKDMNDTQTFPSLFRYMSYSPIKDIGLSALNAYKILENNQKEMNRLRLIDSDNYFHRKGMCEVAQNGMGDAAIGFSGGIAKEAADFIKKTARGDPIFDTIKDNLKDIGNNWQGIVYGVMNPDKDCKVWLEDLDWRNNKFIK